MDSRFSGAVERWQELVGQTRDAVRQELVARQLAAHLPSEPEGVRVLDAGCGQGTQALRLAALGYDITGIDPSEKLLAQAEQTADTLGMTGRVSFLLGSLEEIPKEAGTNFDVVCCHGVLMYLPKLNTAVSQLVQLARPGGVISTLTRNRASIAMRAGMMQDWEGAMSGFNARYYHNRAGVESVRADEPGEVIHAFEQLGSKVLDWYGVRLFTDHWDDVPIPDNFEQILAAEERAGKIDPYRQLTSLTHVIAKKNSFMWQNTADSNV